MRAIVIFLAMLCVYALVYWTTGIMPLNHGAGFDGPVYLDQMDILLKGAEVARSPYHVSRIPAFLPSLLATALGLTRPEIAWFQLIANAVLLAGATALFSAHCDIADARGRLRRWRRSRSWQPGLSWSCRSTTPCSAIT